MVFVLNSGGSLEGPNETFIFLIPKVKSPKLVTNYKPISLCDVLYKIIFKTIANKLKKILPDIISPTHSINIKLLRKIGHMAMKLDMSKAYDRVEWVFLKAVMLNLGFPRDWVKLTMNCTEIVSYSLLVNGTP